MVIVMKKLLIVGVVLVAAVVGALGFYYFSGSDGNQGQDQQQQEFTYLCQDDNYSFRYINEQLHLTDNYFALEAIVQELEPQDGYSASPNCTYMAAKYGINSGNAQLARGYATAYREAYDQAGGLKGSFANSGFETPDEIDTGVLFLEQYNNYSVLEWSGEFEE